MDLFGRTKIYTDALEITAENVCDVVTTAMEDHESNINAIDYLYEYYCGKQAIQNRTKEIREDIMNVITENRAKEIVDFKTGYVCGSPIVYVPRNGDDSAEAVAKLNDYMLVEDRQAMDKIVLEWMFIAGQAYKMTIPDADYFPESDIVPFETVAVDPRKACVVYSHEIGERPMLGIYRVVYSDNTVHYTAYTEKEWFKITDGAITERGINGQGMIPIVEYIPNEARLGAFEPVVPLLDAINKLDSNRMDGVEQFIQSLILLKNCELPEGTNASTLMQSGLLQLKSTSDMDADVKILSEQLNQSQTQTLKEDLYGSILTICAMPNRNGGSSTSDTGIAVVYRDGWSAAETFAQAIEVMYKKCEAQTLKLICKICSDLNALEVSPFNVDTVFTRRAFENNQGKVQVLVQALQSRMIAPRLCFSLSGAFADPEEAWQESKPYYEAYVSSQTEETDISEQ